MDVIVGIGEIGKPWFNLVSKVRQTIGIDLLTEKCVGEWSGELIEILHICIPYSENFVNILVEYALKFNPRVMVVHSTVKPYTTKRLDDDQRLPRNLRIIYSAVRGVHARMEYDLKRYDKFYASYHDNCELYEELLDSMGLKRYRIGNPLTLEYAKILCDTTYFGFLIAYAMITERIAMTHGLDYDEMWMFAHQIHEYLGNRPPCGSPGLNKIYPDSQGIRGHCIMQNLELVKDDIKHVYDLIHTAESECVERHKKKG